MQKTNKQGCPGRESDLREVGGNCNGKLKLQYRPRSQWEGNGNRDGEIHDCHGDAGVVYRVTSVGYAWRRDVLDTGDFSGRREGEGVCSVALVEDEQLDFVPSMI